MISKDKFIILKTKNNDSLSYKKMRCNLVKDIYIKIPATRYEIFAARNVFIPGFKNFFFVPL